MSGDRLVPTSLVWATDIDVLPPSRIVRREGDHLVIRSPSNPSHWWGNYLLFDDAPGAGDGQRWRAAFADAFADAPEVRHVALGWDRTDGEAGAATQELEPAGFTLSATVGLIARPDRIHPHPRANREVTVRALNPAPGDEEALWDEVLEVQVASHDEGGEPIEHYARFARDRLRDLRAAFTTGRGAWYVALTPSGAVAGSCGVVATDGRGRFQQVDTAVAHRRRGISRRLVAEAAAHAASTYGLDTLVIAADPDYHALGIYESLGFAPIERVWQATLPARAAS